VNATVECSIDSCGIERMSLNPDAVLPTTRLALEAA